MTTASIGITQPDDREASAASAALRQIRNYLAHHDDSMVTLVAEQGDPGEPLVVPRSAVELLASILAHMAVGHGVSVVPAHAELTTQQAAELLNVSRPFLIGLLTAGEIDYRMVGTHRRIRAESLLRYRAEDDRRRRAAADELTALFQETGLEG